MWGLLTTALIRDTQRRRISRARRKADVRENEKQSSGRPLLYSLAKAWAWPALKFRCETHPDEASEEFVDHMGDTLLHWMCLGKPPLDAVQAVLKVCPKMAAVRNNSGHLPLHVAIVSRIDSDIIRELIRAYPESTGLPNGFKSYPLQLLCDYGCGVDTMRAVLETPGGAKTVAKTDESLGGHGPLAILFRRSDRRTFARTLYQIKARIEMEKNENEKDDSSIAIIGWEFLQSFRCVLDENLLPHQDDDATTTINSLREQMMALDFWQKAEMLVTVEYRGSPLRRCTEDTSSKKDGMLHAFVNSRYHQNYILATAVFLYPEQLLQPDEGDGRLPLHIAAAHPNSVMLYKILMANKDAAQVRDKKKKTPFDIAVEHFRTQSMFELLAANPMALEARSLDDRLYPYIWSGISRNRNQPDHLFQSIRSNPTLFNRGLP